MGKTMFIVMQLLGRCRGGTAGDRGLGRAALDNREDRGVDGRQGGSSTRERAPSKFQCRGATCRSAPRAFA